MKTVLFPGGPTEEENAVIGSERQVRVDMSKGTLRVHDGSKQGGYELPNTDMVRAMIAERAEDAGGAAATVVYFATQAAMVAAIPSTGMTAIVGEAGLEEVYVWKPGVGEDGTIASAVDGNWHRLDSRTGFYVRLYRAGCINMQFGGAAPGANQDITAWLDGDTVKLWDGAAYLAATPVLFTRLLQKIGNYESSVILPNRLASALVEAANLNAIAETGWSKSAAADANAPSATVSSVFTYYIDANTAYQEFYIANSATTDTYRRTKSAGTWSAWVFCEGKMPDRIAATAVDQGAAANANTMLDSGWYNVQSTVSNLPVVEAGVIHTVRKSASNANQWFYSQSADKIYMRRYASSVWQAWFQVYPANVTTATGTLPRVNLGISTIGQAEAEAGVATTDRIFTAERVKQAIVALANSAHSAILSSLGALSIVDGDVIIGNGANSVTKLGRGSALQVLRVNAAGNGHEYGTVSSGPTQGTEQATTSGTTKDFTGIPSTAKRIIVSFNGVGSDVNANIGVQIGDSGGIESSGYSSYGVVTNSSTIVSTFDRYRVNNTANTGSNVFYGHVILTKLGTGNTWIASGVVIGAADSPFILAGAKTLSDTLTQVRVVSSAAFDGGSVNIMYE